MDMNKKIKTAQQAQSQTGLCLSFYEAEAVIAAVEVGSQAQIISLLEGICRPQDAGYMEGWDQTEGIKPSESISQFQYRNSSYWAAWGALTQEVQINAYKLKGWIASNHAVFCTYDGQVFYANSPHWLISCQKKK